MRSPPAPWRRGTGVALRALVFVGALLALGYVVRSVGTEQVLSLVAQSARLLPLVALLELGCIALDAVATRMALGPRGGLVPLRTLIASHLVAQAVMNIMPAGRGASEAAKATLLAPYVGVPAAIAMGTTNQANVLLSAAIFSLPCALAAHFALGSSELTLAMLLHFAVLFALGAGLRFLQRFPRALRFVERYFARWAVGARRFVEASRETPLLSAGPIAAMLFGRLLQTAEYAVLAYAVGLPIGPMHALAVQGLNLVAAAVGVLVPGQLGSAEAIFAVAAEPLGFTAAQAVSIALLAQVVSLGFTAVGLVVLGVWVSVPGRAVTRSDSG